MAEFALNGVTLVVPDEMLNEKLTAKLSNGGYEAHEAQAAAKRVRTGNRVLELGGGVGYIASICAGLTDPKNVVTVEANPDMLPVIRANLDRNGYQDVTLIHGAVAGLDETKNPIDFERKKTFWAGRLAGEDSNPDAVVQVPHLSLKALLNQYRPHVVIMDIEGAELDILEVMQTRHLFDPIRITLVETHERKFPEMRPRFRALKSQIAQEFSTSKVNLDWI